jgi:hypothetical protein
LDAHFKRDLLLRTIFSEHPEEITEDAVQRSMEWARHELGLRRELWPADEASPVARMCVQIAKAFKKRERNTKTAIIDFCNVRRDGKQAEFGQAWKAMLSNGELVIIGKSRKNTDVFALYTQDDD